MDCAVLKASFSESLVRFWTKERHSKHVKKTYNNLNVAGLGTDQEFPGGVGSRPAI